MHKKDAQASQKKGLLVVSNSRNCILSADLVRGVFRYKKGEPSDAATRFDPLEELISPYLGNIYVNLIRGAAKKRLPSQ